jgi:hypothetical protein
MLTNRSVVLGAMACVAMLVSWSAEAQINLTGSWRDRVDQDNKIRLPGPDFDTFLGLPLNEAARAAALSYTPENISEVDRQCAAWPAHYIVSGPMSVEIWPTKRLDGSVLAWNIGGGIDRMPMTIWMDDRPPPGPQAANTPAGFTIGHWQGDTLVTTTTHIQDSYVYRNGVPSSDREVFTMFITRHDNLLTITGVVHDPVYLTAPYVLSAVFTFDPTTAAGSASTVDATCTPEEEADSAIGDRVPSYLKPPADILTYTTKLYGIPQEATLGGEQTMYPEFISRIARQYRRPQGYCTVDCCGSQGQDGRSLITFNVKVLQCNEINP